MQMTQREIAGRRGAKSAMRARFATEVGLQEAKQGHPEQNPAVAGKGRGFHLLPARPQFAGGGRRQPCRRAVVVNRGLGMERKKEHQGAEHDRQRPPRCLILLESKIHNQERTHSTFLLYV